MKPTSVIFLIVSVLLACVGLLLCFTATNMADAQGVALFTQTGDADNNFTTTLDFDSSEVRKIVMKVSGVDVNIIGGVTESRVELVNFPDGTYDFSLSKSTLQFTDTTAITNIIDIDNFKINFNGFRDYLNYYKYKDRERTVNLYLTDDAAVIILNVQTDGDLQLNNLRCNCDYKCTVSNGDVTVTDIRTDSSVSIESTGDSSINVQSLYTNDLSINGNTAYATVSESTFVRSLYIKISSGAVDYDRAEDDFDGFDVLLRADSGVIKCFGKKTINGYYEEHNHVEELEPLTPDEFSDDGIQPGEEDEGDEAEETSAQTEAPEETSEPGKDSSGAVTDPFTVTIIVAEGNIDVY
jgi:hypothetical protein